MIAAFVNGGTVIVAGLLGTVLGRFIPVRITESLTKALALCVIVIGIMGAVPTENILHPMICLVIGTVCGELIQIERGVDRLGIKLEKRFSKYNGGEGKFVEGFLSSTLLFVVGSMAILGSFDAGIRHDYSVIFAKTIIDGITALSLASAMGIGVMFSGFMVLLYQGALTLLAGFLSQFMDATVLAGMSSVGGIMLIGTGINMLFPSQHIRLANMLPSMFVPIIYFPILRALGIG